MFVLHFMHSDDDLAKKVSRIVELVSSHMHVQNHTGKRACRITYGNIRLLYYVEFR